ncbi:MAG: nucleotidyltransferase domain-containing protein [Promethearchaeia archaeon]
MDSTKERIRKRSKEIFAQMIDKIKEHIRLDAFILFGSRARNDYLPHSDYDILIVGSFQKPYLKRGEWVIEYAPSLAIDLFTYTPDEFDTLFHQYNLTAIDAIGEGIPLYGNPFYKKYKKIYLRFKARGMKKDYKHEVLIPPN